MAALGFERESSKQLSGLVIEEMEFLESKALFQNPKSSSGVARLHPDDGLLFGGLICRDKSGCAGNNSIFLRQSLLLFLLLSLLLMVVVVGAVFLTGRVYITIKSKEKKKKNLLGDEF